MSCDSQAQSERVELELELQAREKEVREKCQSVSSFVTAYYITQSLCYCILHNTESLLLHIT